MEVVKNDINVNESSVVEVNNNTEQKEMYYVRVLNYLHQVSYLSGNVNKDGTPLLSKSVNEGLKLFKSKESADVFVKRHNLNYKTKNVAILPISKLQVPEPKHKKITVPFSVFNQPQEQNQSTENQKDLYCICVLYGGLNLPENVEDFQFMHLATDDSNAIVPKKGLQGCLVWDNLENAKFIAKEYLEHMRKINIQSMVLIRKANEIKEPKDIIKELPKQMLPKLIKVPSTKE